ncbi:MAG TPA: LysR family transcriptional regulator [Caulobacteraceae bacterium]|nr:LysR family transcriptional regulator [Caulobacteraceae bacterium]
MLRISRLRQVMAIHDQGSFAKAARRLGIAQSSLSKSVARLEDELKIKLVERSPQGSRLTPAGGLLAERARALLDGAESLRRDLMLMAGGTPSKIRIGIASALNSGFVPRFALAAAESLPEVRLHFEIVPSHRLMQLLDKRELDLVFAGHPPGERDARLDCADVFTTGSVVVAAPGHPLARMNQVTLEDLRGYASCGLLHGHAKALGVPDSENLQFYQSNCFDAVLPIVEAGRAVLIAPTFVVRRQLEAGTLVRLPCDWAVEVSYSAMTNRGVLETAAIQILISAARRCAADL